MQFIFFLVFIVSVLTCGSVYIGPLSLRVYMTVLMLVYLFVNYSSSRQKRLKTRTDYIRNYAICIVTLGLSLLLNGGFEVYNFIYKCLAFYLVCIVAYFAVDVCVKEPKLFDKLIFVLTLIAVFDAVVTILQFYNTNIGWAIGSAFSNIDDYSGYLDEHDTFEGVSKLPGIFGHPVSNGFYLVVVAPMLLARFNGKQSVFKSISSLLFMVVIVVSLYYLQQRAAFILLILVLVYHYLRDDVKHPFRVASLLLLGILIVYLIEPSFSTDPETNRLSTYDNSARLRVWKQAISVISDNPFFGNLLQYNMRAEYSAHNCFLDSLVNSGIFGFIPLFVLYVRTVLDSFKIMRHSQDIYARVFSYCVLICMAMGMFHNTSYMSGDVIIFICLACMFKSQKMVNLNYV